MRKWHVDPPRYDWDFGGLNTWRWIVTVRDVDVWRNDSNQFGVQWADGAPATAYYGDDRFRFAVSEETYSAVMAVVAMERSHA